MNFKKTILAKAMALGIQKVSLSRRAELLGVKKSTLHDWLNKVKWFGLSLEDVTAMGEKDLAEMLFPRSRLPGDYHQPNWPEIVLESMGNKKSKNSLWRGYLMEVPEGAKAMGRNTFFRELRRIEEELTPEMHHLAISNSYVPAQKAMIDYSGDAIVYWVDGRKKKAQLFVAIVPYTSYTFAYATADMSRASHLRALKELFRFLGGVPDEIWCDNTRALVDKADKADPVVNKEFANFCDQYGTVPYAVGPRSPKQKAPVENAVKLMQKFIIPEVERRSPHSIEEINAHLPALLEEFNATPFSEMPHTSRTRRFLAEEKPLLNDLPMFEYEPGYSVKNLKVSRYNQVRVLGRRIPVFYGHAGETVRAFFNQESGHVRIADPNSGEIIGERHIRDGDGPVLPTTPGELPERLKRYAETKEKLLERIERELGHDAHLVAVSIARRSGGSYATRYLNAMIVESHKFSEEVFSRLCRDLARKGPLTYAAFKTAVVELVRQGKSSKEKKPENSVNTRGAEHYRKLARARRQTTSTEDADGHR